MTKNRILSNNILSLLAIKGWNVKELAKKAGTSRQNVSRYINEHAYPTPKLLKQLAEAFSVDTQALVEPVFNVSKDAELFLKVYKEMKDIYPNQTLLIINPNTYLGFNLATGKKIALKVEEFNWIGKE